MVECISTGRQEEGGSYTCACYQYTGLCQSAHIVDCTQRINKRQFVLKESCWSVQDLVVSRSNLKLGTDGRHYSVSRNTQVRINRSFCTAMTLKYRSWSVIEIARACATKRKLSARRWRKQEDCQSDCFVPI